MTAAEWTLTTLDSVSLGVAFGKAVVDELHETIEAFWRARFGVFVDGFQTVAVLIAEDADGAGEDDALEARQTGGFKEIGHADDIHAGGVKQIAALGREQWRHVVAEGDDALDAVV